VSKKTKARSPIDRVGLAARLMWGGLPLKEAARRASISEEQLRRALGVAELGKSKRTLLEGEEMDQVHMTEHSRKLGDAGLPYGSPAAEEMIAERMRRLGAKGHVAVGQLAASGDLKTMGEVTRQSVSLAEARRGEVSAEERRAQTFYERAKAEASQRGVPLSTVMNERAVRGEVRL
jgi:hypothetical protein